MNRKQKRNSTRTSSTQQDIGKDLIQLLAHFVSDLTGKTARIEKRNRCKINKTFSLEFLLNKTLFSAQTGGI